MDKPLAGRTREPLLPVVALAAALVIVAACGSMDGTATVGSAGGSLGPDQSGAPNDGSGGSFTSGDGADTPPSTSPRVSPGPGSHTVTIHVTVDGSARGGLSKIEGQVQCPAGGTAYDVSLVDFDKATGLPLVPGSEVQELSDVRCQATQMWLAGNGWHVTTTCGTPPPGWSCGVEAPISDVNGAPISAYAVIDVGAAPGNLDVTFVNSFDPAPPTTYGQGVVTP